MFDQLISGTSEFDDVGAAEVFVAMMNSECGTNVTNTATAGGGGDASADCVQVATLPKGLLLDLTRSGQLATLYQEGAFC